MPDDQRAVINRLASVSEFAGVFEPNPLKRQDRTEEILRQWKDAAAAIDGQLKANGLQGWVGNVNLLSKGLLVSCGPTVTFSADFTGMSDPVKNVVRELKHGDVVRITTVTSLTVPKLQITRPPELFLSITLTSPADLVRLERLAK